MPKGFNGVIHWNAFLCVFSDVVNEFSSDNELFLTINENTLEECFLGANRTITSHGLNKKYDHFKLAGHLCYWINKLHPVSCDLFSSKSSNLWKEAFIGFDGSDKLSKELDEIYFSSGSTSPYRVKYFRADDELLKEDPRKNDLLVTVTLLNQSIALLVAYNIITSSHLERLEIEDGINADNRDKHQQMFDDLDGRFCKNFHSLCWSLRKHNHTSRVLALLMESLFKTHYE